MSLGEELRKARMARNLTASQVAAATRMKVQTVEAIESESFARIAAPIYAKGFIKLYAEFVGLDPAPLLAEYSAHFVDAKAAPPVRMDEEPALDRPPAPARPAPPAKDVEARLSSAPRRREPEFTLEPPAATVPEAKAPAAPPAWRTWARSGAQALARALDRLRHAAASGVREGLEEVRAGRDAAAPSEAAPRRKTAWIQGVSIALVVAVLLVFLISGLSSGLSRLFGRKGDAGAAAPAQGRQDVHAAVEPDAPYVD